MPSVDLAHARTAERDPKRAAEDLCNQLGGATPKLAVMFASRDRDQRALNVAVRERLPAGTRLQRRPATSGFSPTRRIRLRGRC